MTIHAAVLDALIAAGATAGMIAAAVRADNEVAENLEAMRRAKEAERKRIARAAAKASAMSADSPDIRGQPGHTPPIPETKVPTPLKTQPLSLPKETPSIEGGKKNPKTRSRIVPDWQPSAQDLGYARSSGLLETDIRREAEKFRDHHLKTGSLFVDWNAAWRTWCQRVNEFAAPPRMNGHHGHGPPKQKSVITLAAEGLRRRGLIPEKSIEDEQFTGTSIDLTAAKASHS